MKYWICFLFLVFSLSSIAAESNISYIFDNIKLNELTKITYSDIVNSGFIADDDFNKDDRTVTIHLKDKSKEQVRAAVKRLIEAYGYEMDIQGNVPYIARKKEKQVEELERHAFYYQPRYRPTAYITDLVSNIFESGRFTYQRPVKTASQETSGQSVQDTGTSAYSMQARNYDAFIFYGTAAEIEQLQALINQIDRPTGEILVKAFIYEVSNGKGDSTAFSAALNLLGSRLNINMAANALANTISLNTGGIEAVFSALSTDNRFKVVSAPSLRVKDREKARFLVGSEVPVLGNVTYQQNGVPVQSVEYKNSGVILDIEPTIRGDVIQLSVSQQLSNFVQTLNGVNNSPTLIKRELSSIVDTHDGDVIIMGGLEEHKDNSSSSGFTWLPRFLRSNSKDSSSSDILLILHVTRL